MGRKLEGVEGVYIEVLSNVRREWKDKISANNQTIRMRVREIHRACGLCHSLE